MSRRTFGDLKVAIIDVGFTHFTPPEPTDSEWSWNPLRGPDGRVGWGMNVVVAQTPTATIVMDPFSLAGETVTSSDPEGTIPTEYVTVPGALLDDGLAAIGVADRDVTHVLVSHAHEDHFGAVFDNARCLRFPNALHVLPAADWESIIVPGHPYAPSADELIALLPLSGEPGGALLITDEYQVCDGVTMISTPGETTGHHSVRFDTSAGRLYVLGDLVHVALELERPGLMGPMSSPPEVRRRLIEQTQERGSTLVFTHGLFPCWGTLEPADEDKWSWRYLEAPQSGDR